MKKRPLILWIIGLALILSPIYYYAEYAYRLKQFPPPLKVADIMSGIKLGGVLLGPVVGVLVLLMHAIGWYVMIGFVLYTLMVNIVIYLQHANPMPFIYTLPGLAVVLYFLRREIRAPYFNPRLRWWQNSRVKTSLRVDVEGHGSIVAATFDISDRGLFLVTEEEFQVGQALDLRVHVNKEAFPCKGEVMWANMGATARPRGVGVRFIKPERPFVQAIRRLRREVERGRQE